MKYGQLYTVIPSVALAVASAVGQAAESIAPAAADVRLAAVSPGCSEDGITFSLHFRLSATITNTSQADLIVSRKLTVGSWYRIAASPEQGRLGSYEIEDYGTELWGDVTEPVFGSRPDPGLFALLQPGRSVTLELEGGVLAADAQDRTPDLAGAFVQTGTTHAHQATFRSWPYPWMSEADTNELAKRWSPWGHLLRAEFSTPFLEFSVPSLVKPCESK